VKLTITRWFFLASKHVFSHNQSLILEQPFILCERNETGVLHLRSAVYDYNIIPSVGPISFPRNTKCSFPLLKNNTLTGFIFNLLYINRFLTFDTSSGVCNTKNNTTTLKVIYDLRISSKYYVLNSKYHKQQNN